MVRGMRKNKKDPILVVTKSLVVKDRNGQKYIQKMLADGWTMEAQTKDTILRSSTVTFTKPNPDYVPKK